MTADTEDEAKPEITRAVAMGNLLRVRAITEAAAAISHNDKIKTINRARKWRERNAAYKTGYAEWFDVTPVTAAAIRGHDAIVEYLLREGADPTLKGCPKDDVDHETREPLIDTPEMHMDAFEAASRLCRKIRRCRRTQDLLSAVEPYWNRCAYSGSSATRHKRNRFSSLPLDPEAPSGGAGGRPEWILDVLRRVPPLREYPLKLESFQEKVAESTESKHRRGAVEVQPQKDEATANVDRGSSSK